MSDCSTTGAAKHGSGTTRSDEHGSLSLSDLLTLARCDVGEVASVCRRRYDERDRALRDARYEHIAVGAEMYYRARDDARYRERFAEEYEVAFGREPKLKKLLRECLVLLYGRRRQDVAGTDAMALREAVRRGISADRVPTYIKKEGGLDRLLRAERARTRPTVALDVTPEHRERLKTMAIDDVIYAKIRKVRDDDSAHAYLAEGFRDKLPMARAK